jgi:hypothetical protein
LFALEWLKKMRDTSTAPMELRPQGKRKDAGGDCHERVLHCTKVSPHMNAQGQSLPNCAARDMSAHNLIADMGTCRIRSKSTQRMRTDFHRHNSKICALSAP